MFGVFYENVSTLFRGKQNSGLQNDLAMQKPAGLTVRSFGGQFVQGGP
jgi:hypothetical protein